jgi:WD40 repeat protein
MHGPFAQNCIPAIGWPAMREMETCGASGPGMGVFVLGNSGKLLTFAPGPGGAEHYHLAADEHRGERHPMSQVYSCWFVIAAVVLTVGSLGRTEPPGTEPAAVDVKRAPAPAGRNDSPLPPGARAHLGSLGFRHWGQASFVAFSPDGKELLTADTDRGIHHWDVATGQEVRRFEEFPYGLGSLVLSPDGNTLADTGEGFCRLWQVGTGKELCMLHVPWLLFAATVFSPDSKTVAVVTMDHAVRICDVATGKERRCLNADDKTDFRVVALAYAPDRRILAAGGDCPGGSVVRLWDPVTGKFIRDLAGPAGSVARLVFTPDGKALVVGYHEAEAVLVLDAATGKERVRLEGSEKLACFTLSPGGKLLAGLSREDDTVRLWNVSTGKQLRSLGKSSQQYVCLSFSPDSTTLAVAGDGQRVRLVDVASGREMRPSKGHRAAVSSVAFSRDGRLVATADVGQRLCLWQAANGRLLRRLLPSPPAEPGEDPRDAPEGIVAFSSDGCRLAGVWLDGTVRVWEVVTGKERRHFLAQDGGVTAVAFSADGKKLALRGADGIIRLWDLDTTTEVRRLRIPDNPVRGATDDLTGDGSVAFSPDGRTITAGGTVRGAHRQEVRPVMYLWEVASGKLCRRLVLPLNSDVQLSPLSFSPDGKALAWRDGDAIWLWELASERQLRQLRGQGTFVTSFAFAPSGRMLAVGTDDGEVSLWDVATGTTMSQAKGHPGAALAVAFSPDGKTLATGSADTTALLWDVDRLRAEQRPRPILLTPARLDLLWDELAGDDALQAAVAGDMLVAAPGQSVAFLKQQLWPVPPADPQLVARWIVELESDRFEVRQRASEELEKVGDLAEPALRKVLGGQPSLEMRRRVEALLRKVEGPVTFPRKLQVLRAVELLERIGSPEAREVLQTLAGGAPASRLTQEARAALVRLARRFADEP